MVFQIGSSSPFSSIKPSPSIHSHPDICVITDELLESFSALSLKGPNIDQNKMLVVCGKTKMLMTDGVGAGLVFCFRAKDYSENPVLGLWYRSPDSDVSIKEGLSIMNERMSEKGASPFSNIEVFAIGGQLEDPEDDTPGNEVEQREIEKIAHRAHIVGVKFNYSKNEEEPLDVVLTPTKIFISKDQIFQRSDQVEYAGYPLKFHLTNHPDIRVIDENNLDQLNGFSFEDVPNVDLEKMEIVIGSAIATDSVGACIAIGARGETREGEPVLALWHRTPQSQVSFEEGIRLMKDRMHEKGCPVFSDIEVFVIGGQKPTSNFASGAASPGSTTSSFNPGTLSEEREIKAHAKQWGVRGVLFNYSKSQREPLEIVLTPTKIFVSKDHHLFQSSPQNTGVGFLVDGDLESVESEYSTDSFSEMSLCSGMDLKGGKIGGKQPQLKPRKTVG